MIGRGRGVDLYIPDPQASRKHVRASLVDGEARIEVCAGAKDILVHGVPSRGAVLRVGDGVVIGETALVLANEPDEDRPSQSQATSRTDVRTLMTGVGADVRGVVTLMTLVDALDAAVDEGGIVVALGRWAADYLSASDATLSAGDGDVALEVPSETPVLVERPGTKAETTLLSAPAHHAEAAWLTFTCDTARSPISATTRRLAVVAGRLTGLAVTRLRSLRRAEEERESFRRTAVGAARSFLGNSPAALEVAKRVPRLATSDATVLLEGETGVGKTFLARLLHDGGPRATEALRVINCAAIPETLIESELFGHERGAFTGAATARAGALESAGRGTVLLDEIGELPLASQAKLLRVLEEKRFERLGSNRPLRLEARVLAATNRDLAEMVEAGTFRRDLFYRIAVVKLRVPPLRDRGEDLVMLANCILADLAPSAGRRIEGFSPAALDAIRRYSWPGNVRELRNAIEHAIVLGDDLLIQQEDFPAGIQASPGDSPDRGSASLLVDAVDGAERKAITDALRAAGGNRTRAAAILGVTRMTLYNKLRRL